MKTRRQVASVASHHQLAVITRLSQQPTILGPRPKASRPRPSRQSLRLLTNHLTIHQPPNEPFVSSLVKTRRQAAPVASHHQLAVPPRLSQQPTFLGPRPKASRPRPSRQSQRLLTNHLTIHQPPNEPFVSSKPQPNTKLTTYLAHFNFSISTPALSPSSTKIPIPQP